MDQVLGSSFSNANDIIGWPVELPRGNYIFGEWRARDSRIAAAEELV